LTGGGFGLDGCASSRAVEGCPPRGGVGGWVSAAVVVFGRTIAETEVRSLPRERISFQVTGTGPCLRESMLADIR
jgi:hypothetical protein